MKEKISHDELLSILHYCPESGVFTWVDPKPNQVKLGSVAGCVNMDGYRHIQISRRFYKASHLAWFYMNGVWPARLIDHKNCIRSDDSYENLREADYRQNSANRKISSNNTSGYKGVSFGKDRNLWRAQIMIRDKTIHLGSHKTAELAHEAYCKAAAELFEEFVRVA